jgi:hypothetical protein
VTFGPHTELGVVVERLEDMRERLERDCARLSRMRAALKEAREARLRNGELRVESADLASRLEAMTERLEGQEGGGPSRRPRGALKPSSGWPRLSWPQISGERYGVLLLSADGSQVLWADETEEPAYTYPADAPPLPAGEYRYRVVPLNGEGNPTGKAYDAPFRVPDPSSPAVGTDGEP